MERFFMKYLVLSLMLFLSFNGQAQKQITKTFRLHDLSHLDLAFDGVYNLSIKTLRTNEVKVVAKSEGEFAQYFVLDTQYDDTKLAISSALDFTYEDANDKLSIHKVQAISIEITIPENLVVTLKSDIANLELRGKYRNFTAQLTSGNAVIHHMREQLKISTIMGNITAYINYAQIDVETKQGTSFVESISTGKTHYVLKSIKGDIRVKKTR